LFEIKRIERLAEVFTLPLVFHDAEVLQIVLNREGPCIIYSLLVPTYQDQEYLASFEVVLKFVGVEKLQLQSFNYQNVVSTLTFKEVIEKTEYASESERRIYVDHETVFGASAFFTCSVIEVISVNKSDQNVGVPLRR
jgi:hypothetical protein